MNPSKGKIGISDVCKTLPLLVLFMLCINGFGQKEELWFGTYTNDEGKINQGRYHVIRNGAVLESVVLAPYGKNPVKFKIIKNDTLQRFVELSWPNKPLRVARLIQYGRGYYAGNFEDGTKILPIVMKEFNFQDAQLQGNWFLPTEVEIKIIEEAKKLLSSEVRWNKSDNRICESKSTYSLFCALYVSSEKVDGEYRHLRPAVRFVREAIQEKYPKKYDHVLVDFNNAKEITLKELHQILELAITNMKQVMDKG